MSRCRFLMVGGQRKSGFSKNLCGIDLWRFERIKGM